MTTPEEAEEITRCAAMQWSMIILDELLKDRPKDREFCIRDLANAE